VAERPVLRVCALYPDLMNIYADRGNLLFLQRRCEWRGMGFQLAGAGIAEEVDPDAHDLFYLGGGQDRDQALCARDLATVKRDALHAAVARGAVVFAVCGGYQLLGRGYELGSETLPGLGLADLDTRREPGERLIGNVAIEVDLGEGPRVLAGFENHGGRTYLGMTATPLGRVLAGHGNNGRDGFEGVRTGAHGTVIGTYLHGPLLPKNAWLSDWLTAAATRVELPPLDDRLEEAAHAAARRAAGVAHG
jgi:lipid II isoglutaminyl synthase (glutamine-hydrolysing)